MSQTMIKQDHKIKELAIMSATIGIIDPTTECCYKYILSELLNDEGIPHIKEYPIPVSFLNPWTDKIIKGPNRAADIYIPDFNESGPVLIELKHLKGGLNNEHTSQLKFYMGKTETPVGYLISFHKPDDIYGNNEPNLDKIQIKKITIIDGKTTITRL